MYGKSGFHLEEPKVGQSYPNYYAAKLASKFVKVVFPAVATSYLLISIEIFQVRKENGIRPIY